MEWKQEVLFKRFKKKYFKKEKKNVLHELDLLLKAALIQNLKRYVIFLQPKL